MSTVSEPPARGVGWIEERAERGTRDQPAKETRDHSAPEANER